MQHWKECPAYFAFGSLIALHRERFLAHAPAFVGGLIPITLAMWFTGLQHAFGLLVCLPCSCFWATKARHSLAG